MKPDDVSQRFSYSLSLAFGIVWALSAAISGALCQPHFNFQVSLTTWWTVLLGLFIPMGLLLCFLTVLINFVLVARFKRVTWSFESGLVLAGVTLVTYCLLIIWPLTHPAGTTKGCL